MSEGNIEVHLENVRLSYFYGFSPKPGKPDKDTGKVGKAKYQASFLFDPDSKTGKKNKAKMEAAIEAAKLAKWGKNQPKLKAEKLCLRDGSEEDYEGYDGMWYVSSSNSRRPTLVDRRGEPTTEEDGLLYSGAYVNAIVNVWAQDNENGKRVNSSFEGAQFVKHGDSFGRKPLPNDAFSDLGDDEDEGEDDEPKKSKSRKSRDDEDEDDEPKKSKSRKSRDDDEDEDDRPQKSKSRSRDDDEDDDEPPRKSKKKSRDDEDDDEDERPRKSTKSRRSRDDEDDDDDERI